MWKRFCNWLFTMHDGEPPATTFAEGQQALMVKLLGRCGIVATFIVVLLAGFLVYLIGWDGPKELQRLALWGLLGVIALYGLTNLCIVLSFAVGGPVGRIDLEATRQGFKVGASQDNT
jgi:hypothetical protein